MQSPQRKILDQNPLLGRMAEIHSRGRYCIDVIVRLKQSSFAPQSIHVSTSLLKYPITLEHMLTWVKVNEYIYIFFKF